MYPFTYHRAADLSDARSRLSADPEARLLAGGMTLLSTMKHRLAAPSSLIDIARLAQLREVVVQPHSVTLGSAIRHQEVADHPALAQALAALCQLASMIGDPQVRARGTLGGSLANADPSADWPAAALALQATICTDRREIEASRFFTGMFATALAPDEIITAVRFARPRQAAYAKQRHQASGYAIVGVFVARLHDDTVRVAVTGAGACVFRWHEAEKRLGDRFSPQALAGLQLPHEGLNSDLHAPARYRAHLAGVLASRATHAITEANEWN